MVLKDVDLKYSAGALKTNKNVALGGTLAVTGAITMGGAAITSGSWLPSDHGLIAWSGDPSNATAATAAVNGSVYLVRLNIRAAQTVTTVWWTQTSGPTTPTAGQNFVGLYNSTGTLLSSVGVDAKTSNGLQSANLDVAQSVSAGFVWLAYVFNAATPPTLMRHGGQNSAANTANLTASTARWAVNGTGQTSLPSSITPSSNSQTGVIAFWGAVS